MEKGKKNVFSLKDIHCINSSRLEELPFLAVAHVNSVGPASFWSDVKHTVVYSFFHWKLGFHPPGYLTREMMVVCGKHSTLSQSVHQVWDLLWRSDISVVLVSQAIHFHHSLLEILLSRTLILIAMNQDDSQ